MPLTKVIKFGGQIFRYGGLVLLVTIITASQIQTAPLNGSALLYLPAIRYDLSPTAQIQLISHVGGLVQPLAIANAGDDRLFIVEKGGTIRIALSDGTLLPTPFLDISGQVSTVNHQGLLGLAFDPAYSTNGHFYVNYTDVVGHTHIVRFTVSADPNIADPTSEEPILFVPQIHTDHNGGDLAFGPDGYLYIPLGDGSSLDNDAPGRAQNPQLLLGKLLRIDVSGSLPYTIPPTNPYINDPDTLDEIWAFGLRSPWRFSFDSLTGQMFLTDVGLHAWEEINIQPANSPGGQNYGWRCYEGLAPFNLTNCGPVSNYTFPEHVVSHQNGNCSITGGYVYRGVQNPSLWGRYIFSDWCSGRFWALEETGGSWEVTELTDESLNPVAFGQDVNGELYVVNFNYQTNGAVYRIQEIP